MLSTEYRLKLEFICKKIANKEEVKLEDMIWVEKLAKANRSAGEMLRKSRRLSQSSNFYKDGLDDFLNSMDLGDPDPSNHKTGFQSADDVIEWFHRDKTDDWRQYD